LKVDGLPVGFDATHQLLQIITKQLNLDVKKLKCLQAREQRRLAFYLKKIADIYFAQGLQKEFALVGETSLVVGLTSFLTNSLGFIPKVLVITDNPSEPYRISIGEKMERLYSPFDTKVVFYEDQGRINETIRQSNVELVLGSSLEQEIAEELHIPFLPVSFPIMGLTILNKSYIGFHGAISFLEDLTAQILLRTG
jgi:nitrogenase molybdenum-iron protein beta chain